MKCLPQLYLDNDCLSCFTVENHEGQRFYLIFVLKQSFI